MTARKSSVTDGRSVRSGSPARPRVRRGNAEDALKLKADLTAAALAIFVELGLDAVSMRAVAERVGVSAMTPYRYFDDKAALLASLWQNVLQGLLAAMAAAADAAAAGSTRVAACTEAYMRYWESHPDEFRLLYQTQQGAHRSERPGEAQAPVYAELLQLLRNNTEGLAAERGASMAHAKLAEDLGHTMMLGYLTAAMVNRRYPWGDLDTLRATAVRQIVACMAQCLLEGPAQVSAAAG